MVTKVIFISENPVLLILKSRLSTYFWVILKLEIIDWKVILLTELYWQWALPILLVIYAT